MELKQMDKLYCVSGDEEGTWVDFLGFVNMTEEGGWEKAREMILQAYDDPFDYPRRFVYWTEKGIVPFQYTPEYDR